MSVMDQPRITVLMGAYNAEGFLREAIDSVLAQTVGDFEFLIFEDCSTDSTRQILQSYDDPRIKLYLNATNQGLTKNLICGMDLAQGAYVARMDADDVCMPNRFERQLEYFASHPEVSVLGSAVTFFDGKGYEFVGYQPEAHDEIKCRLFTGFTMLHPSVMMRKADMDQHGLNYEADFVCSQDHDLWTRSIRKLRFANHPETLLKMREHPSKIGNTRKSTQEELSGRIRRRQLDELEVEYSDEEFEAFDRLAGYGLVTGRTGLMACESILFKVLESNRSCKVFDQKILERAVADAFYGVCRSHLIRKSTLGAYWRKSKLRRFKQSSLREEAVMALRSGCCHILDIKDKCRRRIQNKYKYMKSFSFREWFEGLASYVRFVRYRPAGPAVLMVEPNSFHGEILPGYIHYFNQLGFEVVLLWRQANASSGVFSRLLNAEMPRAFAMSPFWLKRSLAVVPTNRYNHLFLASNYLVVPGGYYGMFVNYLSKQSIFHRQPHLLVEHCFKNLQQDNCLAKHVFLLSELEHPKKAVSMLNPHYFGKVASHALATKRVFVTVGEVTKRNRNFDILIEAVEALESNGFDNFEVHVIGRGANGDLFNGASTKIKPHGYLSYQAMYNVVESADFFLPLLDPENEGHRRYLSGETSGSRQLILGFLKPPIIQAEFANCYDFTPTDAVVYGIEDLAVAMERALCLEPSEYEAMLGELEVLAASVREKSLLNLKAALA